MLVQFATASASRYLAAGVALRVAIFILQHDSGARLRLVSARRIFVRFMVAVARLAALYTDAIAFVVRASKSPRIVTSWHVHVGSNHYLCLKNNINVDLGAFIGGYSILPSS